MEKDAQEKQSKMEYLTNIIERVFEGDDALTIEEMEYHAEQIPDFRKALHDLGLPAGMNIADIHLMFDFEYTGTLSREELHEGMCHLIFNDEFQRDCCHQLIMQEIKKEVHLARDAIMKEISALREEVLQTRVFHNSQEGKEHHLPSKLEKVWESRAPLSPMKATGTASTQPLEDPASSLSLDLSTIASWDGAKVPFPEPDIKAPTEIMEALLEQAKQDDRDQQVSLKDSKLATPPSPPDVDLRASASKAPSGFTINVRLEPSQLLDPLPDDRHYGMPMEDEAPKAPEPTFSFSSSPLTS